MIAAAKPEAGELQLPIPTGSVPFEVLRQRLEQRVGQADAEIAAFGAALPALRDALQSAEAAHAEFELLLSRVDSRRENIAEFLVEHREYLARELMRARRAFREAEMKHSGARAGRDNLDRARAQLAAIAGEDARRGAA